MVGGTLTNRIHMKPAETVFNESSIDLDFRVESNGNTHMLFVDGGANAVGVGATPNATFGSLLYVQGTPAANKPIFSAYSQGNSNKAGIALFNDVGNRGIWTDSNDLLFTTAYEGNSTVHMKIDANGIITKPLQPAFQVIPASVQENLSVGGYTTVIFGTEIFDLNSDFASNTFTAPVTGKYQLNVHIVLLNVDSAHTNLEIAVLTSNRRTQISNNPDHDLASDSGAQSYSFGVLADMDASDTAIVQVAPTSGSAQTDVHVHSAFSGYLVC